MRPLRTAALLALACLCLTTASADARQPGYRTVTAHGVKATVSWAKGFGFLGDDPKITITRNGARMVDHRRLAPICDLCTSIGAPCSAVHVRDLDADGEPEVFVDLFTGGAHCCYSTVFFVLRADHYRARLASWGNGFYRVEDLNGDGRKELTGNDDRFAEEFTAYAMSWRPPMVWQFVGQKLVDATRSFPSLATRDIDDIDAFLPKARRGGDPRGLIAARMADLALLGRQAEIDPYLEAARKRGDLKGTGPWPSDAAFEVALKKFLRKTGYLPA
jgi:hypothetical protein